MSGHERRGGFSILELMVALTIGGIAISSIYAVGAASGRHFRQQQRVASLQSSLRMAMDQVKRDIARAGYLASANAGMPDQLCTPIDSNLHNPGAGRTFAGVAYFDNDVPIAAGPPDNTAVDPTGNNAANGFSADEIVLIGNYASNSEYSGLSVIDNDSVALDQEWQAFRRDFTDWFAGTTPPVLQSAQLQEVFFAGRPVRVQTASRKRFFSTITGVTVPLGAAPVQVHLTDNLGGCMTDVAGGWIAPLSVMRYSVRNATGVDAERFTGTTGPVAQLLRTEVQPANYANPLANTTPQTVLDYVVSFNLEFTLNQNGTAPGQPDNYTIGTWTDDETLISGSTGNPQLIRSVRITLAARAPEQDPRMLWTAAGCADMRCFQVFSDRPGSARVRWLQAEVFVPNIAYEGY